MLKIRKEKVVAIVVILSISAIVFYQVFDEKVNYSQYNFSCKKPDLRNYSEDISNSISSTPLAEINYDISQGKITSYLHTKTAQVQVDIEFVGNEDSASQTANLETIEIAGSLRNVQVIESESTLLTHSEIVLENSTKIQFTLSSNIPVGFTRNIKITFLQDTIELPTSYNYQLGVDWLRRIGTQNSKIIFDKDLALIKCTPNPHTISTIGNRLILSWLEVNRYQFSSNVNFTSPQLIENLDISPSEWNFGEIKRNSKNVEKVFKITNNENIPLEGLIETPDWISINVTNWQLSIGESMFLRVIIDTSSIGSQSGNVSINFSIDAFPIDIAIEVEISKVVNLGLLLGTTISSVVIIGLGVLFFVLYKKDKLVFLKKREKSSQEENTTAEDDKISVTKIDMGKWKEILTEKEFLVFEQILDGRELTQADICRRTDLSKSTISRCVGRLQVKGLVKKTAYGMSNIVSLNDELFKHKE